MGVLSAVLPAALAVGGDIAQPLLIRRKGRAEQLHEPCFLVHQAAQSVIQSLARVLCPAEHGPALHDRIDASLPAAPRAVGGKSPLIPAAVEALFRCGKHACGKGVAALCILFLLQAAQQPSHLPRAEAQEEAQPNALAAAVAEAVVPVARPHQRQAVGAEAAAKTAAKRSLRVLQHASGRAGAHRLLIAVPLFLRQRRRDEIIHPLGAKGKLPRCPHVFAQRPAEPQQIVAAARAHAALHSSPAVPPVHHVAFPVLMAAGVQDTLPGGFSVHKKNVDRILQLVAKADGAAALVQAAARFQAAVHLGETPEVHIPLQRAVAAAQMEAAHFPFKALARRRLCRDRLRPGKQGSQALRRAGAAGQDVPAVGGKA